MWIAGACGRVVCPECANHQCDLLNTGGLHGISPRRRAIAAMRVAGRTYVPSAALVPTQVKAKLLHTSPRFSFEIKRVSSVAHTKDG